MILILNFLILLSTASCKQESRKVHTTDEFTITYPSSLELDQSGQEGTSFILKTEKQGDNDVFVENINLATKNVGNVSFDEFSTKTEKDIKSAVSIKEAKRIKLNNSDCLRLVFNLVQNNVELTFVQHYYIKNKKAYVLTFSSESKMYDSFFEDMNKTLLSFKLK